MNNSEPFTIDVSDKQLDALAIMYVERNCSSESLQTLHKVLQETEDVQLAVYQAIINEMVIKVLTDKIKSEKKYAEFLEYCNTPVCLWKIK